MTQRKIALVTGGSRGLGRDMAINIAKKGLNVIITYHSNEAAANEVVSEIKNAGTNGFTMQLDTSNTADFHMFYSKLTERLKCELQSDRIDYLVNNAGTGLARSIAETSEEEFDAMLSIHLKGVYFLTQKTLPILNDGGGIINISSGLTRFSFPGMSAYATMKGAVEVFTRYLAKELGERRIKANVVAPGAIATDFAGGSNKNEQKAGIISGITALGRVGEAEDIGGIVAFLCTDDARWINGQRIEASGGMLV